MSITRLKHLGMYELEGIYANTHVTYTQKKIYDICTYAASSETQLHLWALVFH